MIPNSFRDELEKNAVFLPTIAKFLSKNIPSMLGSVKGGIASAGLTGAVSSRVIGGVAGGAAGAYGGSKVGNPENKQRNTLIGGAVGAAAGAIGMGRLAPKLKNFGTQAAADLKGLGEHMTQDYATKQTTINYAARSLTPQYAAVSGKAAPTTKNFFGMGAKTTAKAEQTSKPSFIGGLVGEAGKAVQTIQGASNPVKGIGNVLKDNWKDLETFNKTVGGKTYQFQRSGLGKIVNPAMMSGIGFGAQEALTSTNADGSKRGVGSRIAHGAGTMVGWGAAPKLMTAKLVGYDLPKMFTGMKKPTQAGQGITQI